MKVLVVEDDRKVAGFVEQGLQEEGYVVDVAADGDEATLLAHVYEYDIILLDVILPKKNGFQVAMELRREGRKTPILMLTSRDAVEDVVRGLDAGADDYLVKPFAFAELLARVRTILRRPQMREPAVLRAGDLELDLAGHRATRAGQRLDLSAREFVLLSLLVRRKGEVLTRTMIAQAVWDMNFPAETNVVDVSVRRLRSKVDDPFPRKLLRTVRGVGYVLETAE